MIKEFCDRCGKEVSGKKSSAVSGVPDADRDGDGTAKDAANILCSRCYRAIWTFIRGGPFVGNPKPLCQTCLRRVYGMAKGGGWWCSHCEAWIVKPRRK